MKTEIQFNTPEGALKGATGLLILGTPENLKADVVTACIPESARPAWAAMIADAKPGDMGITRNLYTDGDVRQIGAGILPTRASRHNCPTRPDAISAIVRRATPSGENIAILVAVGTADEAIAAACAVGRALPAYTRKTSKASRRRRIIQVGVIPTDGGTVDLDEVTAVAEGVRFAARLVDAPTSELDTEAFVDVARETAARVGGEVTVIEGIALGQGGFGGLWGVGKAATKGPALVMMSRPGEGRRITLIGKGIVYDTGGLSIKGKTNMPGMKADMGGAAAVLGAFAALCRTNTHHHIDALLCIAENSVGPDSTRPDDILTMYSGRTVEVNNTDAEGRLVLADGMAYAVKHLNPEIIIDLATLTGAQLVATGRRHAACYCNDDGLERTAVEAGRRSGDLVHPLPYVPEFFRREFKSPFADMKNSVKDRMNASSACAGQFIGEHMGDYAGKWLHLDIAGPAGEGEYGTGYGVALLVELLSRL